MEGSGRGMMEGRWNADGKEMERNGREMKKGMGSEKREGGGENKESLNK